MKSTELHRIKRRRHSLRRSHTAFEAAVREAVAAGNPKVRVAEAAGISRPTLDAILRR